MNIKDIEGKVLFTTLCKNFTIHYTLYTIISNPKTGDFLMRYCIWNW